MNDTRHIEVEMMFLPTAEGGRDTPAMSGYHPQFTYDGIGSSATQTYIGTRQVCPGETVRAYITFYTGNLDWHAQRLHVGKTFTIQEGDQIVATGHVTRILAL